MRLRLLAAILTIACGAACSNVVGRAKVRSPEKRDVIACDVAIVGGGVAGLYAAYRLSEVRGGICLFEANTQLGGRVHDVMGPGGLLGVGARRFDESHAFVEDLATKLGIDYQPTEPFVDRFVVGGIDARSKDAVARLGFRRLYEKYCPHAGTKPCVGSTVEENILKLADGKVPKDGETIEDFYRRLVGADEFRFLLAVASFKGDYSSGIDARSYLDWLRSELELSSKLNYPVGGMSRFVTELADGARKRGARLFVNEEVERVDRDPSAKHSIRLSTKTFETVPSFVFLAVNSLDLSRISGSLVQPITEDQHFQTLAPIPVVVVTQWWKEPWWERLPSRLRATRVFTTDHCIGRLEIPTDAFGRASRAIRSVYNDDPKCLAFWQAAKAEGRVDDEVRRGMSILFPGVKIPPPAKTDATIWRDGWYWQRAGARFSNEEIARWAEQPVAEAPVALIGDSYDPNYATWTDGAYRSALRALHRHFDIDCDPSICPCANEPKTQKRSSAPDRGALGGPALQSTGSFSGAP